METIRILSGYFLKSPYLSEFYKDFVLAHNA
jgi:hypothetical protein